MPVKIETSEFEEEMLDMLFLDEPITEPLLSDDIWKKFELDFPEFSGIADIFFQEEQTLFHDSQDIEVQQGCMFHASNSNGNPVVGAGVLSCSPPTSANEIRHHDCMWAGHCGSKEHDDRLNGGGCFLVPDPLTIRPPPPPPPPKMAVVKKEEPDDEQQYQQSQYQQQQATRSVLKPAVRAAVKQQQQQQHMPQTPPMSDDEEGKTKPSKVLSLLSNDPVSPACAGYSSDSELCEYLEEEEEAEDDEEEEEEEEEDDDEEENEEINKKLEAVNAAAAVKLEEMVDRAVRVKAAAESDHSYHKGKGADHHILQEYLGIETPSDSEEEIDVVSVVDKLSFTINNRVTSLPNNPSTRDKQQIQRRVATAISRNNRMTNSAGAGIKTILPVRKNAPSLAESQVTSPAKRKSTMTSECRNTKRRPRKYKTGYSVPYKRRLYGNSSDSEPEPSEKRSLHNNMERQRRIDLRNAFEDLRQLIPEVSKKDRAAKVLILKEAAQYCDNLTKTSINQQKHMEDLKRHQEWLRNRVSQLRRSLAAKR